jgi:hypothetical protein
MVVIPPPAPAGPTAITGNYWSANDYITGALRLIGVVAAGEPLDDEDAASGLPALNQMIRSMQNERLMFPAVIRQGPYALTPGIQNYYVGQPLPQVLPAGYAAITPANSTNGIPRPQRIENFGIITQINSSQPLELPMEILTNQQWLAIPTKNVTSTLPLKVYPDLESPLMTLFVWPIPSAPCQITIYAWDSALQQFPDAITAILFPPGYEEAIKFNLAVRLAPEYNKEASPTVQAIAVSSKAVIKSFNTPQIPKRFIGEMSGDGGYYNWISDSPISR